MQKSDQLNFDQITPMAPQGLGGLVRDHFGNGRLFATVCAHGGLTDISYWGRQHLGAPHFFHGDPQSSWVKLFRAYAGVGGERYILTLNDTRLYPFGYSSRAEVEGVSFKHQMLLLPDAVVHRFRVVGNPRKLPVRIETLHQEGCSATMRSNRTWSDFELIPEINALVASCTDLNPNIRKGDDGSLAQRGSPLVVHDSPKATIWIGIGCDSPMTYHRGYHARSKHYLAGSSIKGDCAALFMVFAQSRKNLEARLAELRHKVHGECNALINGYEQRLLVRPRIDTGNKVLNSAFSQFPECTQQMKLPDRLGAVRSTLAGYFVWGWDGINTALSSILANEPDYAAAILFFNQKMRHQMVGLPHSFTSTFQPILKSPFSAQAQFIAALYHVISVTGDLDLAKKLMPTCQFIIDRCRERLVKDTGLVEGVALWPDFPEAMEENGHDISSMNNSLLYQGLRAMEYLASAVVGDSSCRASACGSPREKASRQAAALQSQNALQLAVECREWAKKLRKSFVKYLYDRKVGFFISSCDSRTFKPRKHYCAQAVFWITPFARELVSHAPQRIADFMNHELRTDKCLLTLPHWDKAWMADGNQLGSTFPTADLFYLNAQKLVANAAGLELWLGDVEWFWRQHTAPEAFTPEAENEVDMGVDNPGCKQLQTTSNWYFGLYTGLAGLDFDHEGLTLTPWGDRPLSIKGLRLHGVSVDLMISGSGSHVGSLKLNGKVLPSGSRKILWSQLKGKTAHIELIRSRKAPGCPVIIRADGLRLEVLESGKKRLRAIVNGTISGEVVVQTKSSTITVPYTPGRPKEIDLP